jgi:succinoglycan biosynthesis transport protein ExoP
MELLEYWRILKNRLWLIVLLGLLGAAAGFYYVRQQVPLYTTSTTLFLNPVSPSPLLPYQTTLSAQSLANTYAQFIETRSFASLVAEEVSYDLSEGEILTAISAQLLPETQFFKISATHPSPEVAQALANNAAEVLMAENTNRQRAQREQMEAQRDPAKLAERQRLTELEKTLQDEIDYTDDRIAGLQAQIAELGARPPSEEIDGQVLELRGELLQQQSLRVELFGSLAQAQAALANMDEVSNVLVDTAVVVDPAPLPTVPASAGLVRFLLLGLVAGTGLGVGIAFLLEYMDYTVRTPEELDTVYGLSTLGVIGAFREANNRGGNPTDLMALHYPRSPVVEAFRALRTNLQFARPGDPIRSLLVTSAGPSEGKTSVSANLALILAQAGKRVILVDADLRRPRVHRLFDLPSQPGLTGLIVDPDGGVEGYLQPTEEENLWVLPCGELPRNPAELLGSARAAEVMAELTEHADMVIYDSPPAATVTDAVVLGSRVDGVVQVVQAGGPRRDLVLRAKGLLEKVGAPLLGPVLNQVDAGDMGYYAYYYYYGSEHGDDGQGRRPWWRRVLGRKKVRPRSSRNRASEGNEPGRSSGTGDEG